jgi:outer membrane protein
MNIRFARGAAIALLAVVATASRTACAETLAEAAALAYRYHPALRAQRAALDGLNEGHVQAHAAYGPSANLQVSAQSSRLTRDEQDFLGREKRVTTDAGTDTAGLSISQPLYSGGRTRAAVAAADAEIFIGRETLRQTEAQVMQDVVMAYVSVQAAQDFLTLAMANVDILGRELDEIRARFDVRQVTRTDLAQAEARLAAAQAAREQARGRLGASRARYAAVVGQQPDGLEAAPALPEVPDDLDAALKIADANSPSLGLARHAERLAQARLDQARAEARASVDLRLSASRGPVEPENDRFDETSTRAMITFSQPLFTNGLNASRVRQASAEIRRRQDLTEQARLELIQTLSQAMEQLRSVIAGRSALERQASALDVVVKGVQREREFGLRTVVDVLNAEQERQSAQAGLVQSRLDEYGARVSLLAGLGLLEARFLAPELETFDAAKRFTRVRGRGAVPWSGVSAAIDEMASGRSPGR